MTPHRLSHTYSVNSATLHGRVPTSTTWFYYLLIKYGPYRCWSTVVPSSIVKVITAFLISSSSHSYFRLPVSDFSFLFPKTRRLLVLSTRFVGRRTGFYLQPNLRPSCLKAFFHNLCTCDPISDILPIRPLPRFLSNDTHF